MAAGTQLYEGKAKKIFETAKSDQVIQYFKDDATAFNAQKRGTIVEKGIINNKISERLFRLLEQGGVPTHFIERLSDREMLTKKVTIVPIEVVVRNRDDLAHAVASLAPDGSGSFDPHTRRITVAARDGARDLVEVVGRLREDRIEVDDVGLRRPTLDEVFLTLTGRPAEETEEGDEEPEEELAA